MRINGMIRVPQVRTVDGEGKMLGVLATPEALDLAKTAGLDLVEVDPRSDPPVCRIMDFGRYKYLQKKKQHGTEKKKSSSLKGMWLRPKIGQHDRDIKVNRVRKFLTAHHRVQITMRFRGREREHLDLAREMLQGIAEELADVARVEQNVSMAGRRMTMTLVPK